MNLDNCYSFLCPEYSSMLYNIRSNFLKTVNWFELLEMRGKKAFEKIVTISNRRITLRNQNKIWNIGAEIPTVQDRMKLLHSRIF